MSADYFTQVANVPTESALAEHELADVESSTWRRGVTNAIGNELPTIIPFEDILEVNMN